MSLPASARLLLAMTLAAAAAAAAIAAADSGRDVRPILSDHCFTCHGPDAGKRKAKLRLDVREVALDKQAIVPGDPDASELIYRIHADDPEEHMPPPESRAPLTAAQKEILRRWIAEGAEYEAHWSYLPLARPEVPW
jgi:mono/diheme cytochrome c family protein